MTLDTTGISYGSGYYIINSFSQQTSAPAITRSLVRSLLFDYTNDSYGAHWQNSYYTNGIYNNTNFIKNDYLGDWIIVKLPTPVILTKNCFKDTDGTNYRAPAE